MKNVYLAAAVFAVVSVVFVSCETNETPSVQCEGENFEDLRQRIQVIPCGKKSCKLRKGTNTTVVFKFKIDHEVKTLVNDVYARVAGIPLPFLGVTGVNACPQIVFAKDGSPAPCPLAPGEEYIYTNAFPIESFYPTVDMQVHWGLKDGDKNVICFEVPAVITKAKTN